MASKIIFSTKTPSPNWFKKLKTAVSLTTNTAILILLAMGHAEESLLMLLVKVGSSYLMQMLDLLLGESVAEPIIIQQQSATQTADDTIFPTDGPPQGPK